MQINYEGTGSVFFDPFILGMRHLRAIPQETCWRGRVVHLLTGVAELCPLINCIIAFIDRFFHPVINEEQPRTSQQAFIEIIISFRQQMGGQGLCKPENSLEQDIEALNAEGLSSWEELEVLGLFTFDRCHQDILPALPPDDFTDRPVQGTLVLGPSRDMVLATSLEEPRNPSPPIAGASGHQVFWNNIVCQIVFACKAM